MSFLNPLLLLGTLGIGLPILAHLLNRYQVRHTDWAAMRFLNRSVRVRSRQLRLRDIILLILRCLALLLVVLALTRPVTRSPNAGFAALGERRVGVIIALDASYSMQHSDGTGTRFDRALEKIDGIMEEMRPGNPVTLVLLGSEHRVVARNVAFDPDAIKHLLDARTPTVEPLNIDSLPGRLKELAGEMKAPQKEIYIVTDMQERDWKNRSVWLQQSFENLAADAAVFIVPITGGSENLAITGLDLVSGVLRKGTTARYRATVRNCGTMVANTVRVNGLVNDISVDVKVIPAIAPGTSETVSLFIPFSDPGPVRIQAELDADALPTDNLRRIVAVVRDRVNVLCVEGASQGSDSTGRLIGAALRARGTTKGPDDIDVQMVSWVDLPAQDLTRFDVVILANVPDITDEQARSLEDYVRAGNGLIWFAGDNVKADVWNRRAALEGTSLLPAVIGKAERTGDALGVGQPLDPTMPDHPVCRPLLSLPEDLLSETRFRRLLSVTPAATSGQILTLAGSDNPILLEHTIGRGHVFMFTTTAGSEWNNMAVTPVFPMLIQQMVTYLTAREFETSRTVGDSLSLSYMDQPDASDAVFDTPSGETIAVPVREHRNQYVAVLKQASEAGFYIARVSVQAAGLPVAVNVDTRESTVQGLPLADARHSFAGTGIRIAGSDADLASVVEQARTSSSWWRILLLGGLLLLVVESLVAEWLLKSKGSKTVRSGADA